MRLSAECAAGHAAHEGSAAALDHSLAVLLRDLEALAQIADRKLAAMRAADSHALEAAALDEGELLRGVASAAEQRGALLAQFARHVRPDGGPAPTLRLLADASPEPVRSRLRARALGLQTASELLQRKNRVVAEVARRLHEHVQAVFADVARAAHDSGLYNGQGERPAGGRAGWVEAVG